MAEDFDSIAAIAPCVRQCFECWWALEIAVEELDLDPRLLVSREKLQQPERLGSFGQASIREWCAILLAGHFFADLPVSTAYWFGFTGGKR